MRAARLVADDDQIGLTAMQQSERHPGVRRMEQGTLPLDDVPVPCGCIGTQQLRGARLKICDHRVHRQAASRDQNSSLSRRPEMHRHTALGKCARQSKRRILFADGAIGADGEQALARALAARGDGNVGRRSSHVDEPPAVAVRGVLEARNRGELRMHAADQVESCLERFG